MQRSSAVTEPGVATSTGEPALRVVRLDHERRLEIRKVQPRDLRGLAALYEGLDDEARCLRFFSLYRPPQPFFERLTTVADRGGVGLIAVVLGSGDDERIVADASAERLPNGNGEFALTVDRAWRGWLGAYLLDALVEEAAQSGVPNLEAVILTRNRPMLALVRARGYVVVPSEDWTEVRVVIGATRRFPTWSVPRRDIRVLVEGPGSAHWDSHRDFPDGGATVLGCAGPPGRHLRCPAISGEPCPLAASADLIVISRPPDTPEWSALRRAHAQLHPGVPVNVEPPAGPLLRADTRPAGTEASVERRIAAPR